MDLTKLWFERLNEAERSEASSTSPAQSRRSVLFQDFFRVHHFKMFENRLTSKMFIKSGISFGSVYGSSRYPRCILGNETILDYTRTVSSDPSVRKGLAWRETYCTYKGFLESCSHQTNRSKYFGKIQKSKIVPKCQRL